MTAARGHIEALAALRRELPLALEPASTALLAVDLQAYFLRGDSPYARFLEARVPGYTADYLARVEAEVLPNAQRLLAACRARGMRVFWTALASALPDGGDLAAPLRRLNEAAAAKGLGPACPWRGDAWAAISPRLEPLPGEPVVYKTTYGAFASTRLEHALHNLGIDTLLVCGVVTNVCVESSVREAVDHGFGVVVAGDACAAYAPEVHEASLLSLQAVFGQVRTTAELTALLRAAGPDTAQSL